MKILSRKQAKERGYAITFPVAPLRGFKDCGTCIDEVQVMTEREEALVDALRYALNAIERGDTSDMQPVRDALENYDAL